MEKYIVCPLCGKQIKRMKRHFITAKVHKGFDYETYLKSHPEVPLLSESERLRYSSSQKNYCNTDKGSKQMSQMALKFWSDNRLREKRLREIRDQHQTNEFKELHREVGRRWMTEAMSNPDFYNKALSNIRSRGQRIEFTKNDGSKIKLRSKLEYFIAEYLSENNIEFDYENFPVKYIDKDGFDHIYYIDFILTDFNIGVEGKPESLWSREDTQLKLKFASKVFDKVVIVGYDLSPLRKIIESVTTIESITKEKNFSE